MIVNRVLDILDSDEHKTSPWVILRAGHIIYMSPCARDYLYGSGYVKETENEVSVSELLLYLFFFFIEKNMAVQEV